MSDDLPWYSPEILRFFDQGALCMEDVYAHDRFPVLRLTYDVPGETFPRSKDFHEAEDADREAWHASRRFRVPVTYARVWQPTCSRFHERVLWSEVVQVTVTDARKFARWRREHAARGD